MANPWDMVFDRVRVRRDGGVIPGPPLTDSDLDAVESQMASPLPRSYREFMKRFGPGGVGSWVNLLKPSEVPSDTRDHTDFYGTEGFANAPFLTGLIYFATSTGGDAYAWDPTDITSPELCECRVYYLERAHEENPVVAGNSFWEFLPWAENQYRDLREVDVEGDPSGIRFHSCNYRLKSKPKHSDAQRWLHFNNRTARLIAYSIRDRGQTDAFPILADALQEAGCDNADLLDSCRTGDPDIDGKWVLQVLLGNASTK